MNLKFLTVHVAAIALLGGFSSDAVAQGGSCRSGTNCTQPPILCGIDGGPCAVGAPYDLSRFNISFPVIWPTPPTTSRTIVVDTCAEFQSAVRQRNVLINVAAGSYTSCNLNFEGDDIDIVMSNNATLFGTVTMDTGPSDYVERVRWTGGNINTGGASPGPGAGGGWWVAVRDILISDVYINGAVHFSVVQTQPSWSIRRIAFINSTIDATATNVSFPLFIQQDSQNVWHEDLIIANSKFQGDVNNSIRIQQMNRSIVVESAFNARDLSTSGFRFGENCNNAFVGGTPGKNTIIVGLNHLAHFEVMPQPYAIRNVVWDGVTHYFTQNQAFWSQAAENTGVINNFTTYYTTGAGAPPASLSPFTPGVNIANVRPWDGVTLPDVSSYGAQR